jgi:hypothetical protein
VEPTCVPARVWASCMPEFPSRVVCEVVLMLTGRVAGAGTHVDANRGQARDGDHRGTEFLACGAPPGPLRDSSNQSPTDTGMGNATRRQAGATPTRVAVLGARGCAPRLMVAGVIQHQRAVTGGSSAVVAWLPTGLRERTVSHHRRHFLGPLCRGISPTRSNLRAGSWLGWQRAGCRWPCASCGCSLIDGRCAGVVACTPCVYAALHAVVH